VEVISNYAWLALLLDVGCGPYLVLALTFLLPEIWSTSRFNLLREYLGQQGIKTVYLRLFRRGIFTIQLHFQRPPGELGLTQCGAVGKWHRHGSRLTLAALLYNASSDWTTRPPEKQYQDLKKRCFTNKLMRFRVFYGDLELLNHQLQSFANSAG
jgi:hypothetical protein